MPNADNYNSKHCQMLIKSAQNSPISVIAKAQAWGNPSAKSFLNYWIASSLFQMKKHGSTQ